MQSLVKNVKNSNSYKKFIEYEILNGHFFLLKNNKKRRIFPNEDGYLIFYRDSKRYKVKANKLAIELGNNIIIQKEKVVLHKNLDTQDYRLINLTLLTRQNFNKVREAHRNLSGFLRMTPHPSDMFSYIVQWKENGITRMQVFYDIIFARRLYIKLQLKFAKILNKFCIFEN